MALLDDIAVEAGVSPRTVLNVLNGRNKENWPSTLRRAEQIRAVADRLGYRPNGAASAIRSGRFGCVALLLSQFKHRSSLFQGVLDGICDVLDEHDLHLTLARYPEEQADFSPKFLRQHMCDGLIINYNAEIPEPLITQARQALPAVWLNSRHEADCVRPDDFAAGRDATQQLIELGHRRIAWTSHGSPHYSVEERRAGYEAALKKARLKPILMRGPHDGEGWLHVALEMLKASPRPTAFVNYSSLTMQPIACAALNLGLQVPRDLSLITFGDGAFYDATTGWHLSGWQWPEREVGRCAVEMLMEKIAEPSRQFAPRVIAFAPGANQSVGPAPAALSGEKR